MALEGPPKGPRFPPGGPGGIGRPFPEVQQALSKVHEAHTEVWEGSEGPPGGLGGVESPFRRFGRPFRRSKRPSRRFGWGQQALPEVLEVLPNVQDGSRGRTKGPEGVGRPFWRTWRGQEALS